MNSILGYYPYTLFQTLLLSTQDNRRGRRYLTMRSHEFSPLKTTRVRVEWIHPLPVKVEA